MKSCFFIPCAVVLLAWITVGKSDTCSPFIPNTSYYGMDVAVTPATDQSQCCALCLANPACTAVVFLTGNCYLKNPAGSNSTIQGPAAGSLQFPQRSAAIGTCSPFVEATSYNGYDMTAIAADPSQCCAYCEGTPGCTAVVYWGGSCWLKNPSATVATMQGSNAGTLQYPQGTCSAPIPNTSYNGYDMVSYPEADERLCCAHCLQNPGCTAVVYWNGGCYLKNPPTTANTMTGATVGTLRYPTRS